MVGCLLVVLINKSGRLLTDVVGRLVVVLVAPVDGDLQVHLTPDIEDRCHAVCAHVVVGVEVSYAQLVTEHAFDDEARTRREARPGDIDEVSTELGPEVWCYL